VTLPRLLRISRQRLRSVSQKADLDRELDSELAFHFDQLVLELTAAGMTPEDARREARRALGNLPAIADRCRDARGVNWLHDFRQDVAFGLRMLRRAPVLAAVVVGSLALGIGANTAVLSVLQSVFVDGLPVPDADRLVVVRTFPLDRPDQVVNATVHDVIVWRERSRAFDRLDVTLQGPRDVSEDGVGRPAERLTGQDVTPGLFTTLGMPPLIGRVFTDAEAAPRATPTVVISHRLWRSRFAGDPDILRKELRVNGVVRTIVGVMPPEFRFQDPRIDFWMPLYLPPTQQSGTPRYFYVIARLAPGVTIERARADVSSIAASLATEFPEWNRGYGARVEPLLDVLYGWTRQPLGTLQAAVALVLLIACANIAGLLLARASARQREMAMRIALGAGRGRIIRQLLTESLIVSLMGGGLGLLVAWVGIQGIAAIHPPLAAPWIVPIVIGPRVLGIAMLLSIGAAVAFGMAPALAASQMDPLGPIRDQAPGRLLRRTSIVRTALVSVQLAVALMLLIGSGLLLKSFVRLTNRDLHFDRSGLLLFEVRHPVPSRPLGIYRGFSYFEMSPERSQSVQRVHERLQRIPDAESVAGISFPPVNSLILPVLDVLVEHPDTEGVGPGSRQFRAAYFLVTPKFFQTMRTPLVKGREFDETDRPSRPWTVVVNESAARLFWPGEDAIGHRLTLDVVPDEQPREVIGVVRDIPTRSEQIDPQPVVYASYLQQPARYRAPWGTMFGGMTYVLRTAAGDPRRLLPAARQAVAEVAPDRPLTDVRTGEDYFAFARNNRRYYVSLVGVLACSAAILAAIGVYGVMAYAVSQRTREIGIRKALGAGTPAIVRLVGQRATVLIVFGLAMGWAGALTLTRLIASQLWGITPTDPATFVAVSLLLVAVALLACFVPARRATQVDPTIALRCE
jgi:putative ABC transport system permease protein